MGRRGAGPAAVCPAHPDSYVISKGNRRTKSGVRRVFRCSPEAEIPHSFTIVMAGKVPVPLWSPPPPCPLHEAGHVVRDGRYASTTESARQRYRCYPDPADRTAYHRFTPWLPREHVHTGTDRCDACEELRGTHRGEASVSRRQSWSARLVADGLRDLARGATYAKVSKQAREATGRTRTRSGSGKPRKGGASSEAKNRWHTAADWVETYGPVLWAHTEEQRRAADTAEVARRAELRAAGETDPTPLVIAIDALPVYAKWTNTETGRRSGRPIYSVLVLSQVRWRKRGEQIERDTKLRLARAYPGNDHHAWKLVLSELGYVPDFIISDADDSQAKAIREMYAGEPFPPVVIPSLFHVRFNIEEGLRKDTPGAWVREDASQPLALRTEIEDHLTRLGRQHIAGLSSAEWSRWWDDLEALLAGFGLPVEPTRARRAESEAMVAAVLPIIADYPQLPLSTGGVEVAIRSKIDPILAGRGHAFANLTRTNRLLDLVVCDDWGLFNKMPAVIELLRVDSDSNQGWSPPLRTATDPQPPKATARTGRYGSLRDQLLLRELARQRGLS